MPARPLIQICVQSHQTCDGPMGLMCSVMVVGLCAGCDGSKPTLSSQPEWGWPASLRECLCATPATPTLPLTGGREPDPYSNACKSAAAARSAGNLRCALASDKRAVGACSATAAQVRPLALRTGTATAIKPAMNSSRSQA